MADITIDVRDVKTGALVPMKAVDNGDGTYTSDAAILAMFPQSGYMAPQSVKPKRTIWSFIKEILWLTQ